METNLIGRRIVEVLGRPCSGTIVAVAFYQSSPHISDLDAWVLGDEYGDIKRHRVTDLTLEVPHE